MTDYLFPPPEVTSLPVTGTRARAQASPGVAWRPCPDL